MKRKKWTAKEEVTESDLKFRLKRKWQLALRRYILEKNPSQFYAPYFGLEIEDFREWISLQFLKDINWENFATSWQFDHIVPVAYFDFNDVEDLKLCWNFTNIRVEVQDYNKARGNKIDVLAVKPYFETLYKNTGYELCSKMVNKIDAIQLSNIICEPALENFIINNTEKLKKLSSLNEEDYYRINKGLKMEELLLEKEIFKKFG